MTDEEIKALVDEFNRKVSLDPEIRSVMQKIRNQDADFSDTSRMFWRRSELLRDYLQGIVLDLPAGTREQLCTALLNAGYNETNEVMQSVQQAQDEPQGIHLNPVLPKRPAERIHTVAHALEDPTVPDDKIVRRAGAPVANVNMSFHDKYIEENAKIRAKLGMKPTITRYGSGCCSWCSAVAGRYRFGDQPKDIFRRHDNCGCTIIYDNQVLRGRETSSGRSKTWEEVKPEDVLTDGFSPKIFSQSEAEELQERLMQYLTKPGQGDIITGRGSGTGSASGEHTFEKIGEVDPNDKKAVASLLVEFERKYQNSDIEHCRVITASGEVYEVHGDRYSVNTTLLGDRMIGSTNEHNHVTGESQHSFSWEDLRDSADDGSKVVIAYDEKHRYHMIFPDKKLDSDAVYDAYERAKESLGNDLIFNPERIQEGDEQHERIRRACEELGIEYSRKAFSR